MRTYRFRNRYSREVDVAGEAAVMLLNNPSMTLIGEVITEEKVVDVPKKRIITKTKYKEDKNGKRGAYEVEEEEEYMDKELKTVVTINTESTPTSNTDDVDYRGQQVRLRTSVNSGGDNFKRSTIDKKYK